MADVFINYRTSDEAYAAVLLDEKLCERFGDDRIFRDSRSIDAGEDYRPKLWGALAKARVFIVVIGAAWLRRDGHGQRMIDDEDDFVRQEIRLALKIGIRVIPVLVGNVPRLEPADLPSDIALLAHRQFRRLSPRGVQHEISRVLDDVAEILADAPGSPGDERAQRSGTAAMVRVGRRNPRREHLRGMLTEAAAGAGLPGPRLTDHDDGLGVYVPAPAPPIRLAGGFVECLDTALTQSDLPAITVGVCTVDGPVQDAFSQLARLVCLPELDGVLRQARKARLLLVVPDGFFSDVVRADPHLVDLSTFLPLVPDTGGARCWVRVPGYPAPPGLASEPAPEPAARAAPAVTGNYGTVFLNQGTVNGNQYAGDHILGDTHIYGPDGRRR